MRLVRSLLGSKSAAALQAHLEYTHFHAGNVLEAADRPIAWMFFPDTALVSLTASGFAGRGVGVGLVGYGGLTGVALILGSECSTYARATVEVAGSGGSWRPRISPSSQ